jgi:glycosyltransferase involved in cell wall biosynthesis
MQRTAQGKTAPLVSVVVPTHNRPNMLAEALASVRAQTITDYEVIVVSNGEDDPDRSRLAADACGAQFCVMPEGNVSAARNLGIKLATGAWIAFLDDDDLWFPDKLDLQLKAAEMTGADMICSDYVDQFDDGREKIVRPRLRAGQSYLEAISEMRDWWAATPTVMVRRSVVTGLNGFDPRLYYGEDVDLWRRIAQRHTIHQIPEILARVRRGHPSLTRRSRMCRIYDIIHWLKMYRDTPAGLRSTLPSFWQIVLPRIIELVVPKLIRQPLHPKRLRKRWRQIRAMLTRRRPGDGERGVRHG